MSLLSRTKHSEGKPNGRQRYGVGGHLHYNAPTGPIGRSYEWAKADQDRSDQQKDIEAWAV